MVLLDTPAVAASERVYPASYEVGAQRVPRRREGLADGAAGQRPVAGDRPRKGDREASKPPPTLSPRRAASRLITMELPMIVKRNPGAVAIAGAAFKTRVVAPRKGRGSYSRKGRNR